MLETHRKSSDLCEVDRHQQGRPYESCVPQQIRGQGNQEHVWKRTLSRTVRGDPPWEDIKILVSDVAMNAMQNRNLMFIDISKAYLFAPVVQPNIFIDLPPEVHQEGKRERFRKALYGRRDAVHAWEKEYTNTLIELGITGGGSSACILRHKELDMESVIHGDDFTVSGDCDDLKKCDEDLPRQDQEGAWARSPDLKEITLPNRVITWMQNTSACIHVTPAPVSHAPILSDHSDCNPQNHSNASNRWFKFVSTK